MNKKAIVWTSEEADPLEKEIIMRNILLFGDNYDCLTHLLEDKKNYGTVRLIYIDPPYGTKQDFTFSDERFSTISRMNGGNLAYDDHLTGEEYLKFLSGRLRLMYQLLSDNGSIYLHIDSKMGHYVKVLMDEIFGPENFINDITRIKCNPKNFYRKGYGNVKDMILFYAKTKKYVWNEPRENITITDTDKRFRQIDENGRRFTTTPLHAPGETENGVTGKKWRGKKPPIGRHWRYAPGVLDELDKQGLIHWSANGNPRKKIYADDVMMAGTKMQDIWTFKDPQNPKYPTEKNMDLLKMIIRASSNEGDIVLDAFCGSGTTLVASRELNRYFIGMDKSKQAIKICKDRLSGFDLIQPVKTKIQ
jgi:adenine-specific DNA-methyltransferase